MTDGRVSLLRLLFVCLASVCCASISPCRARRLLDSSSGCVSMNLCVMSLCTDTDRHRQTQTVMSLCTDTDAARHRHRHLSNTCVCGASELMSLLSAFARDV